jgi:hypothetical protein
MPERGRIFDETGCFLTHPTLCRQLLLLTRIVVTHLGPLPFPPQSDAAGGSACLILGPYFGRKLSSEL